MTILKSKIKYFLILFFFVVLSYVFINNNNHIDKNVIIDKILVYKSMHKMEIYEKNKLIKTYKIAIGRGGKGAKELEGDEKTPEGIYYINSKNKDSGYHNNLGISYPNEKDIKRGKKLNKPTGGDIKIHGLKNGFGFIGKFHLLFDWTLGCIALSNDEIDELSQHTPIGTIIEIKH
jgi:murein L,D-transpeptidase YafK